MPASDHTSTDRRAIQIFAHRGSTILAPENTAQAFDLALACGADVLETDVRLSRDGTVFVTHDDTLDRTTNGHGRVCDHDAEALSGLNAAHRFVAPDERSTHAADAQLMTLDALLAKYSGTRINVDIKDNSATAAVAVASCIERASATSRVTVGSFHAMALARFRAAAPKVATAATQSEVARLYFGRYLPSAGARRTRAADRPGTAYQWLQIPPRWRGIPLATRNFIATAHAANIRIAYWTINDADTMRDLIARGADAIVTDRPDIACRLRDE